jgi:hypothetical protein
MDWPTLLDKLAGLNVLIPDVAGIEGYMAEHEDMTNLVLMVCSEARRLLGDGVELSLELCPALPREYGYPVLYARRERYNGDFWETIDRVREAYQHQLIHLPGWFLVMTDFMPPTTGQRREAPPR